MKLFPVLGLCTGALLLGGIPPALADDASRYTPVNAAGQIEMTLREHRFSPAEIHVPPNKRIEILLKNQDDTADEFDSTSLKVEKVVGGNSEGVVRIRPLTPGTYPFMGEFHAGTAQGKVIVE